jgi:hypothetical protein
MDINLVENYFVYYLYLDAIKNVLAGKGSLLSSVHGYKKECCTSQDYVSVIE